MRMPKYRVWIKNEKKMYGEGHDGWVDYVRACGEPDVNGTDVEIIDETGYSISYRFDEVVLMEYTGLKDDNGIEIYENDVIECFPNFTLRQIEGIKEFTSEVYYSPGGFYVSTKKRPGIAISQLLKKIIIGNILENPELKK